MMRRSTIIPLILLVTIVGSAVILISAFVHRVDYTVEKRLYDHADQDSRSSHPVLRAVLLAREMTHEVWLKEPGGSVSLNTVEVGPQAVLSFDTALVKSADTRELERPLENLVPSGKAAKESVMVTVSAIDEDKKSHQLKEGINLDVAEGQFWTKVRIPIKNKKSVRLMELRIEVDGGDTDGILVAVLRPAVISRDSETFVRFRKPRQVIFVTLDTTRRDFLGIYGDGITKTPGLDMFAGEAVVFDNCYSATNTTGPSHASIFTSLHLKDHNVISNFNAMPDSHQFMARIFKASGFKTAAFVSGGPLDPKKSGFAQGFDEYSYYTRYNQRRAEDTNLYLLNWLNNNNKNDFFVWVHYFDPHMPYVPPYPYNTMHSKTSNWFFKMEDLSEQVVEIAPGYFNNSSDVEFYRNLYRGEISYMDEHIGKLFQRMKDLKIYDNCMVVVVADHGESLGEHGIYFNHAGLYEGVIKVPLIIKLNNSETAGRRQQLVSTLDIYPTVIDAMGLNTAYAVRGRSLVGIINNEGSAVINDKVYATHASNYQIAEISSKYKFIKHLVDMSLARDARYIKGKVETYDLEHDAEELHDISKVEYAEVRKLEDGLSAFMKDRLPIKSETISDEEYINKLKSLGYVQ